MLKEFDGAAISQLEKRFRANLINTLAGIKSPALIGSIAKSGQQNLAIFNSIIHIGANPPLMGFLLRPTTVRRHTYENIKESGAYTINFLNRSLIEKAHQTSAKYEADCSEFEYCGFQPYFSKKIIAPYVAESPLQLGLHFVEEHLIQANGTRLVIGSIEEIRLPEAWITPTGHINHEASKIIQVAGLDTYYESQFVVQLPYAQVPSSEDANQN